MSKGPSGLLLGAAALAALMFMPRGGGAAIPIGDGRTLTPDGTIRDASGRVIGRTSPTTYQQASAIQRAAASVQPATQDMSLQQMVTLGAQLAPGIVSTLSDVLRTIDSMDPITTEDVAWGGTTEAAQAAYQDYRAGERDLSIVVGAEPDPALVTEPASEVWWAPEDAWWADPNYVAPPEPALVSEPIEYVDYFPEPAPEIVYEYYDVPAEAPVDPYVDYGWF